MKTLREPTHALTSLALAVAASVVLTPRVAHAHGGPPSAMGLLAAGNDGPAVILLNEGLAIKRPEAWSFMCPSLWGEVNQASGKFPLARSANGAETWVAGSSDLYVLRDQELLAVNRPELRRNEMIALANDTEHVYGLHYTLEGESNSSEVVRLSEQAEPAFWASDVYWPLLTANEQGVFVGRVPGLMQLELVTLDKQGQEQSRVMGATSLTLNESQLHAFGDRVYVTGTDGTSWLFGYFEAGVWKEVMQSNETILGPQASPDGSVWIALGGVLQRVKDVTTEDVGETRMITCLEQWNDWHYACVGPDLHQLTEAGLGERVFALDGFHAPDPKYVPADRKSECDAQWTLYSIDAMRVGMKFLEWPGASDPAAGAAGAPAAGSAAGAAATNNAGAGGATSVAGPTVMADPASGSGGGCSATPAAAHNALSWWLAAACAAFLARRRRTS
jgi:hypothetical protein